MINIDKIRSKGDRFTGIEQILFLTGLGLLLYPVVAHNYYLTGDGPSHVYNSRLLLDWISGKNVDFYKEFYHLNSNSDPNWMSHLILATFQLVLPPAVGERVFITLYILGFALAFRSLIGIISKGNQFLSVMALPFALHHTFQMGFYNYSLSFVFYLILVRYWLIHSLKWSALSIGTFLFLSFLLYFSHPIGYLLSGLTIGILVLLKSRSSIFTIIMGSKSILREAGHLFLLYLPSLILFAGYLNRKGLNVSENSDSLDYLQQRFFELSSLVTLTDAENPWTTCFSILFWCLFVYALYVKIRSAKWVVYDAFLIVGIISAILYFFQPGTVAGAGVLSVRLQFIPYLIWLIWLSGQLYTDHFKWLVSILSIILIAGLVYARVPIHKLASEGVRECFVVHERIPDHSVVLPLSFNHNGSTPDGQNIANRKWLFMHSFDYLGAEKSLLLLGNYEANTGYFPIIWNTDKNPFVHLSQDSGLEAQPPCVDISGYETRIKRQIDYIVTWCESDPSIRDDCGRNVRLEFPELFDQIYESEQGRVRLYKRKSDTL